ncbi:glycogen debranching protein [Streptomyces sp. SAJ15]|nr:glycogen debranching protein [Streptomyces sp. SAJ15]
MVPTDPTVGRPAPPPRAATGRAAPTPQPVHRALICVSMPAFAISDEHGQLTGQGLDGFYRSGRRVLARCRLRVAGQDPLPVQGQLVGADRARFVSTVRTSADPGPDPGVSVERLRHADGTERITLRSASPRAVRLPVELAVGTDLAELAAVGTGLAGPELPGSVHDSGMRWATTGGIHAVVAADPAPTDTLAHAGLLRWDVELDPGAAHSIELRVRLETPPATRPTAMGAAAAAPAAAPPGQSPEHLWRAARAQGDDARVEDLLRTALGDLCGLLVRDRGHPADSYLVAGVPWRCGLAPAEALWAARLTLPLGTRLAAGTLRTLARTQRTGRGSDAGHIPGSLRHSGPHLPPGCTGVEATLLFPVVLAEARRWGLPDREVGPLLDAVEGCLRWLLAAAGESGFIPDPAPGGPYRCETQAHAHRAALLGADLLDAYGRPGGAQAREWAAALRGRFREDFWIDDLAGGRPAAALLAGGRPVAHLGGAAAHLLDTGLLGGGRLAAGLLDPARTEQLARLLGSPALDSGWGLRSLGAKEPGHNPFGHRGGAVRVHETAVAVAGLAAAGYEKEAGALLRGALDAAQHFGHRLPEMYAGEQRVTGGVPLPHPAACRPAAVAAAGAAQLLITAAGVRPDVPGGSVAVRPMHTAPLGAVQFTGLRVAEQPFALRVSRLGLGMVEEAADGLQLGG